jgi:hypothetical protein
MPDAEETRWKARYARVAAAHQELASAIARLEARIEAVEKVIANEAVEVVQAARLAKADREATRKRRLAERIQASREARALRDKP